MASPKQPTSAANASQHPAPHNLYKLKPGFFFSKQVQNSSTASIPSIKSSAGSTVCRSIHKDNHCKNSSIIIPSKSSVSKIHPLQCHDSKRKSHSWEPASQNKYDKYLWQKKLYSHKNQPVATQSIELH